MYNIVHSCYSIVKKYSIIYENVMVSYLTSQLCKYEKALSKKIVHPLLIKVNQTHISICPFVKVIGQNLSGELNE